MKSILKTLTEAYDINCLVVAQINLARIPDMSTMLNDLISLANSLSFCLDSLSIFAVRPGNKFVPAAKDQFIPFAGAEDLFSTNVGLFGFGITIFSTNFHKTVS